MRLEALVAAVANVHSRMDERATRSVNISLTLRNWLIGAYITQYELGGADRATYGGRVFEALAKRLRGSGIGRADARELRRYKRFFEAYPQIRDSVTPNWPKCHSFHYRKFGSRRLPDWLHQVEPW